MLIRIAISLMLVPLFMIAPAAADTWSLLTDESTLSFSGLQSGSRFEGQFKKFDAEIDFTPEALESAKISITIDLTSADSGSADRDATLPGTEWFDTANHPTATFISTDIGATETGYEARGTLTIKGSTNQIVLPFGLTIEGNHAHATGTVAINRNDYNVGSGPLSPLVSHEITISFDINATR